MSSLQDLQNNWEGLAQSDPLWSICTDPRKRHNQWDEDEFFETGGREVGTVLGRIRSLGICLDPAAPVLDFGCGVGRLTRALAEHFEECWGVDISATMIQKAKEFHKGNPHCTFWLNQTDDLQVFSDGFFGFIYTSIVLQHIERKYAQKYLTEFIRILKPEGVLVFQVLDRYKSGFIRKLRINLALRSRLEGLIRRIRGQIEPRIEMHCIKEGAVRKLLAGRNVRVVDVAFTNSPSPAFNGDLQYLDQEPREGFVSKQYGIVKHT